MAHWIGAQGQLKWDKNSKTCLLCDLIKRKLAESVDGLNSSVAIAAGEL